MASKPTRPQETEAPAPTNEDPKVSSVPTEEEAREASGKMVKHLPHELFSARVISEDAWKSIGVYDQRGVEWNETNGFQLPVEMFNDAALDYLVNRDDGFEIVGG